MHPFPAFVPNCRINKPREQQALMDVQLGAQPKTTRAAGAAGRAARRAACGLVLTSQIWKEEGEKEGSEGAGWIVGVKECEAEGEEGPSAEARKEKGGVVAEEKGVGGWRYGKRAVLAAMAMEAAQEVLPRVKQALEQMRAGNGGGGDAAWLQGLVQHERVCGGMVSADGENAPNEMAVSACDAALHTKWLHHEGGKGNFCLSRLAFRQPLFTGKWDSQRREELGVGTPTFYP
ncbi:unnamed protein product [Closterium sp. Naga37s-1]|nr:unnamed protein product [Closterium sp. Naga37s-1]